MNKQGTLVGVAAAAIFAVQAFAAETPGAMSKAQAQQYIARAFSNVEVSEVRRAAVPGVYEVVSEGAVYYLSGDGGFLLAGTPYKLKRDAALSQRVRTDPDALKPTPMPGVYELVSNGKIYYLSKDGAFALTGVLYDLMSDVNLTERLRNEMRRDVVAQIEDDKVIAYSPPRYRYTVNVFSDPECPYCRKFHGLIGEYNELGIRVRYLLTPLLGAQARAQAVGVWCSKDRRAALDRAKRGEPVERGGCKHPIDDNLALGKLLVKSELVTPLILLENGKLIIGYRDPVELLQILKEEGIQPRT